MLHIVTAACMATLSVQTQGAAAPAFGRITGRVVISGSTTPLAGAQVTLVPMRRGPMTSPPALPPGPPPQRISGDDGRFIFASVLPGEYRIRVSKAGYASDAGLTFGGPARSSTVVTAGSAVDVGDLPLERGGVITGRVLGVDGEPVAEARVSPLRRRETTGNRLQQMPPAFPTGSPVQTNDLGEFRLFGLAAGDYLISASPRLAPGEAMTHATTVETTTYFPSTPDINAATSVTVTPAAETNGIEIRLAKVPAFRVSGIVVDGNGQPMAGAMVMLMRTNPVGIGGPNGSVRTRQDGQFTVNGVVAGAYHASAAVPMPMGASGAAGAGVAGGVSGGIVSGTGFTFSSNGTNGADVTVSDGDVTGVRIVIQAR